MTAASYSTDLSTLLLEFPNTTGWTALGGGAAGLNAPETDYFIQGNNCITKNAWASAVKGMIYDFGSGITVPTDGAVIMFLTHATMNSVATQANGGIQMLVGSSSSAFKQWYVSGSDRVVFGRWRSYCVNPAVTQDATTGSPGAALQFFGAQANLPSGGPSKGSPFGIDAMRYGRCRIDAIDGDAGNGYATLAGCEATANSLTNRWGLLQLVDGSYQFQGFLSFGTASTPVDWRDANRVITIAATDKVTAGFNRFEILNSGSNVELTNYQIRALGTTSRGLWVVTAGQCTLADCQFIDMDTFAFLASSTVSNCTFRGCNAITAPGTSMVGSKVIAPTVAADSSAVVWDVNSDPDGELDNMTVTRGPNAHHALAFGTNAPLTMTLRGWSVSGFSASHGDDDSTFLFPDTGSDVTWTLNIVGGSGNFTYKKARAGDTVDIVQNPVTLKATAVDSLTGSPIQGARCVVVGAPTFTGGASVSISQTAGTATVSHTGHGFATGDSIRVYGCNEPEYNGFKQITVTGPNEYTYAIDSGASSPATGSPVSAILIINALTDSSGEASDSRTWPTDQVFSGFMKKPTPFPAYANQPFGGTIDNSTGASVAAPMVRD